MTSAKPCPFCGARETFKEADFGTSLMVSRYYCARCHSTFEAIKWGDRTAPLDLPAFLQGADTPRHDR